MAALEQVVVPLRNEDPGLHRWKSFQNPGETALLISVSSLESFFGIRVRKLESQRVRGLQGGFYWGSFDASVNELAGGKFGRLRRHITLMIILFEYCSSFGLAKIRYWFTPRNTVAS